MVTSGRKCDTDMKRRNVRTKDAFTKLSLVMKNKTSKSIPRFEFGKHMSRHIDNCECWTLNNDLTKKL